MDDLCHQIENAADAGKLASGISDVWKQATLHKGHLLIVEKKLCVVRTGKERKR